MVNFQFLEFYSLVSLQVAEHLTIHKFFIAREPIAALFYATQFYSSFETILKSLFCLPISNICSDAIDTQPTRWFGGRFPVNPDFAAFDTCVSHQSSLGDSILQLWSRWLISNSRASFVSGFKQACARLEGLLFWPLDSSSP